MTGCKSCLVNNGLKTKGDNIDKSSKYTHWFYDLLFKKFRAVLGGKVRIMVTGAAPINDDIK